MNLLLKSYMLFQMLAFGTYANDENNVLRITHWRVPPFSYICTCTPTKIALQDPALNASNWDDICSNLQVCTWNNHEILVRTWYHGA